MISALFNKIIHRSSTLPEHFLALLITETRVKAALFFLENNKVEIAMIGEGVDWDGKTEDSLVKSADVSVTSCGDLSLGVKKVIFGIPENWVVEGKITAEHLPFIKKVSRELELSPLGFVNLPEAIEHFLKQTEGVPLTGILVRIKEGLVSLALSRVGKRDNSVISQEKIEISLQVAHLLKNYTHVEVLPSRIILYDGNSNLEGIRQELMSYPWTQKHAFLHFPKVEIIGEEEEIKAIAVAAGTEMGGKWEVDDNGQEVEAKEEKKEIENEETESAVNEPMEDLGFVEGDIAREKQTTTVDNKSTIKIVLPKISLPSFQTPNLQFLEMIKLKVKKFLSLGIIIIPVIIIIIGLITFYLLYIAPKAEIKLFVDSKPIDKEITVALSSKSWEANVVGSQKTVATGKKTIGDKAKGEITVYNKTFSVKSFKKGDVVTLSGNKLKFTLDDDVKIASASEKIDSTLYGKEKVKVTATDIGTKYNLDSNNTFSLLDYSETSFSAKNEQAFSGGSSREVTAVVQADIDRVSASLSAELTRKAKEQISNKLNSDEELLNAPIVLTINKKKFDKEKDTEAIDLTLEAEATVKMYGYIKDDLLKEVEKNAKQLIPDGYELKRENISTNIKKSDLKKDGSLELLITFSAKMVPLYKKEEIIKNITGKRFSTANEYLRKLEGVVDYNIDITPRILGGIKLLPFQSKNINLNIVVK